MDARIQQRRQRQRQPLVITQHSPLRAEQLQIWGTGRIQALVELRPATVQLQGLVELHQVTVQLLVLAVQRPATEQPLVPVELLRTRLLVTQQTIRITAAARLLPTKLERPTTRIRHPRNSRMSGESSALQGSFCGNLSRTRMASLPCLSQVRSQVRSTK